VDLEIVVAKQKSMQMRRRKTLGRRIMVVSERVIETQGNNSEEIP